MYVFIDWWVDGRIDCVYVYGYKPHLALRGQLASHFSPSTMWASGVKLRLLGLLVWTLTHLFIVFAFFYCFMFHLGVSFLSLSFWQKWHIPLKKFFWVLAPSQLDLNLWHYHSSFVHIYLNTYGPTRVGDRHSSLWPYYIIWSRVTSWCKDCSYWTAAWDNSPCYSGWVFSDSFFPHCLIPPAIATDIRTLPPCSLWCCSWTLLSLHYFG